MRSNRPSLRPSVSVGRVCIVGLARTEAQLLAPSCRNDFARRDLNYHVWRDAQTLHSCYQLATTDGMLEVMSTPVKLRDRKVSSK
jgi:hypothetical protein